MSRRSENLVSNDSDQSPNPRSQNSEFTPEQRKILLSIARASIASGLAQPTASHEMADGEPAGVERANGESSTSSQASSPAWLVEPRGVFTTLYLGEHLRGCVGYALPIHSLHRAVGETARAAAFDDSRFPPVTPEEARRLSISLSVLSPLFPIAATEVEVGRHGLFISSGNRRGLLLPQVPVEHAWDREEFLAQTCRKAGLPPDAWRNPASPNLITIEAFTAEVFGDADVS